MSALSFNCNLLAIAIARKADRTAYDVRYSCRTLNNRTAEICMSGIVMVTKLPLAIQTCKFGGWLFTAFLI